MSQNFLEIQDVTFAASKKNKVNNVTFNLEKEGEIICLLGPSGIGKTTILRTIAGLEKIENGKIFLKGKTISSPDFHMEPEKRNVNPKRLVFAEKTSLPMHLARHKFGDIAKSYGNKWAGEPIQNPIGQHWVQDQFKIKQAGIK